MVGGVEALTKSVDNKSYGPGGGREWDGMRTHTYWGTESDTVHKYVFGR